MLNPYRAKFASVNGAQVKFQDTTCSCTLKTIVMHLPHQENINVSILHTQKKFPREYWSIRCTNLLV